MSDRITDPLVRMTLYKKQLAATSERYRDLVTVKGLEFAAAEAEQKCVDVKEEYECLKALLTPDQEQDMIAHILSQEEPDTIVDGTITAGKITANSISAGSITASKLPAVVQAATDFDALVAKAKAMRANNNNNKV